MGALGGNALRLRRVTARGDRLAIVARALAEAQGHMVVDEAADLLIVEANDVDDLPESDIPMVVMCCRRMRPSQVQRLRDAGAARVLDTSASVLDVAFVFADLLFESLCAQRRYARDHGGPRVTFRAPNSSSPGPAQGRLVGIARAGTYIITEDVEPVGTPIEMQLELAGQPVRLLGRVACQVGQDDRRGFGVEFALDSNDVAPRLADLCQLLTVGGDKPSSSSSILA